MRLRSKWSELTAGLSLDRSLKRFLLRPAERSRREARRLCSAKRRSRARFWSSENGQRGRLGTKLCCLSYLRGQAALARLRGKRCLRHCRLN